MGGIKYNHKIKLDNGGIMNSARFDGTKLFLLLFDLYWLRYKKPSMQWYELTDYLRECLKKDGVKISYDDKYKDVKFSIDRFAPFDKDNDKEELPCRGSIRKMVDSSGLWHEKLKDMAEDDDLKIKLRFRLLGFWIHFKKALKELK